MSTMRASRKPSRSKIVRAAVTRAVWVARPRAVFAPVGASGVERELLRAGLLNVTQHATPRERRRTQSSDRGDARRRTVDDGPLRMRIVLAAGIVAGTAVLAIAAMLLVRRRAPEGSYFEDGDRAAGVFGVLATGFAVLVGFVVFLAFQSYDTSRSGAETESQIVLQQFETAQLMPAAVRGRFSGELVCYARSVVHQEWPQMQSGTLGNGHNAWGIAMFRTLKTVEPRSAAEQAAYSKWLDQRTDRESARADRTHGA